VLGASLYQYIQGGVSMVTTEKLNKSEKIRRLFDAGLSVTEIAALMGIRYQFAYNVISHHVKAKGMGVVANDSTGVIYTRGVRVSV
jgi:DNA invertase Pin-like site-specific DNA recombinase